MSDKKDRSLVLPIRLNPDVELIQSPTIEFVDQSGDGGGLAFSDIRMIYEGLIKRDCEAPSKEQWDRWAATPEGQAELERRRVQQARRANNELRMLTLSERHVDGDGFSMKMLECDRAQTRKLIVDGWNFDEATTAWANEVEPE